MSKIQGVPFVAKLVGSLTDEQCATLLNYINGGDTSVAFRSLINATYKITTDDKGVSYVSLETKDANYTGYLVYNNTYCSLISFIKGTQKINVINIDLTNQTYNVVKEECDILELRYEVVKKLKADLVNGKIPASQLPSYVDDVIEGYYYNDKFYSDLSHTEEITGETGKIYVDLATGNTYRWSGTVYAQIGGGGAKVVEVQLTAQNETDLLTNGSVTVALSAADGADLIGSELNMIKLEGADLGDVYLYKQNGVDDTNFYFGSLSSMFEGAVIFDGTDYSLYLATNQPLEVVGNPTIPAGATVNPLNALKIGSDYFNIDKPIHFIKLTSTTLTEALRSEILSDDYYVVIEYNNDYYYERRNITSVKYFETLITISEQGSTGYDRVVKNEYKKFEVSINELTISISSVNLQAINKYDKNVSIKDINSKTNSFTNATAGKVLTADGSGGTSWEPTIPTVSIALTQVVQADPLQIQLTDAQYNVFANNKQVIVDITAINPNGAVVVWEYTDDDSSNIIFGYSNGAESANYYYDISIVKSTKIGSFNFGAKKISYANILKSSSADDNKLLGFDSLGNCTTTNNLPILTTAPTAANTEGGIKIVVLSSEPATKYNGYLYIITGA